MKNTLKYALGAVLTAALVAPAMAQDNFPDVPENHWAYEALAKMKKEGLLVGYPDGLYRGGRPASRYEMAVALHALYERLKGMIDGVNGQLETLKGQVGQGGGNTNNSDLENRVKALEAAVASMKGWGDSIGNMQKMASTFEKELASLGVDVEAMKKDLADLKSRVEKLEKNTFPVMIHGDANLFVMAGHSTSNRAGVTVDGRPVGVQDTIFGGGVYAPVGASQDLSVFHEAGIELSGTNEAGPKWHATLAVGNMIGGNAWAGQAGTSVGAPFSESTTDVYFQNFVVSWNDSLMKQGFSADLGRMPYSLGRYILQKPDNTPYFENARWDNKGYTVDGASFGFNFGAAKLGVTMGRSSNRLTTNGNEITGIALGAVAPRFTPGGARPVGLPGGVVMADQLLGVSLNVPLTEKGGLNLAYLFTEANNRGVNNVNRAEVFGGDAKFDFGTFNVWGGYSQSNLKDGKANVVNKDNYAWYAGAGFKVANVNLSAQYREIMPLFAAPGDWGRIGMWWNPTDIKGFGAKANFALGAIDVNLGGQWYQGTGKLANGLQTSDKINRYVGELGFKVNDAWSAMLGGEWVEWKLAGGKPREAWYSLGLGYHLSENTKLKLMYQISDYDSKGTPGFGLFPTAGSANGSRATGGLITTQLSVKF